MLDEKKAENITCINIQNITTIAKYLIITSANSQAHAGSLARYVVEFFQMNNLVNLLNKKEVDTGNPWILIDASDFLINVFSKDTRDFYALEKIYFKGNVIYQS